MLFVTRADRIVLWVTLAYAREYRIQHYAYAPVTKRDARELSRYFEKKDLKEIGSAWLTPTSVRSLFEL